MSLSLLHLHLWKIILQDTAFWLFNFKYSLHSLACMVPKENWDIIIIFVFLGKDSSLLPLQFLSRVFLYYWFSEGLNIMGMPRCSLFKQFSCLVFFEHPRSIVWFLTLIWRNFWHYYFKYFFCYFLSSLSDFPITHMF